MCAAGGGKSTGTLVTEKSGLSSLVSSESSRFQKPSARLASPAVLYRSTAVRTSVMPAAPVNALPYSRAYPPSRPSFFNVFGVASGV